MKSFPVLVSIVAFLIWGAPGTSAPAEARSTLLSLSAPQAKSVAVVGSFNQWDPSRHPLAGPDETGVWTIMLHLEPGRYEYLFVINGNHWVPNPSALSIDGGFGTRNSVLFIAPD